MNKPKIGKKISSLALGSSMLVMSLLPTASAFAATTPSVTLLGSSLTANVGGHVNFVASAHNVSNPEYQFWVETPSGKWIVGQNYSSNNSFTLSNVQNGDYLVNVDVLSASQVKAGQWSKAVNTLSKGVFVNSSVKVSGPSGTIQKGQKVTINAAASNIYSPLYQFWYQTPSGTWMQSGTYSSNNSYTFTATETGSYKFTAYAKSPMAVNNYTGALSAPAVTKKVHRDVTGVTVSGTNSFSAGSSTTLTAVATNNGVAVSNPADVKWTVTSSNGNASNVTFGSPMSGKTSFNVPSSDPGTYTVTATVNGVTSKSYTIKAYGQAAAVKLSPSSSKLVADGKATDTITATVVDSHGNPVKNFNGTATVAMSGDTFASSAPTSVTFTNGSGTFAIPGVSGSANVDYSVSNLDTSSGGAVSSNFPVASGSVSVVQPQASSIKVTSGLPDLSVNKQTSDNVTVQLLDQAGNPIAGSQLVNLSVSGQGSLSSSSAQTSATVLTSSSDGTAVVPIYDEQGVPGSISISASASGLHSGSLSVPTYVTTAPANLAISGKTATTSAAVSGGTSTIPSGTPYTVYTADLVDQNGHVITTGSASSGSLTISDNTSSTSGNLEYFALNSSGQPSTYLGDSSSISSAAASLNNGQTQVAVFNTKTGSSNPTITINDSSAHLSATTSYSFTAGPAAQVAPTTSYKSATVGSGTTRTFTYQLQDANGNTVSKAGVPVYFYFDGTDGAGATLPNGASPTGSDSAVSGGFAPASGYYVADTNASGQASVTVSVPSSSTSGSYQLAANLSGGTAVAGDGPSMTVNTASNLATSVGLVSGSGTLSGTLTAGSSPTATVELYNAVDALASGTTDQVKVTTSNPNVVSLASGSGWTVSSSGNSVTGTVSGGELAIPTGVLTANKVGSATVTVSDPSNPSVPSITENVTVQAGNYSKVIAVSPSSATSGTLAVSSSGVYGPYTIEATDSQGNVLPAPEAITLTSGQVEALVTGQNGATFNGVRTSSGGSDVSSVTIPAGATSAQVYLDTSLASGSTSGDIHAYSATNTSATTLDSVVPVASGMTASHTSGTAVVTNFAATHWHSGSTIVLKDANTGSTVTGTISGSSVSSSSTSATFNVPSGSLTSGDVYVLQNVSGATINGNKELIISTVSGKA